MGVPQGSSLGPLLFLIYINDVRLCLSSTEAGHFADDTLIMYANRNMKTIKTVVNYELKLVTQRMKLNKLSLNTDKINFVLFHSRQNLFDKGNLSIKFNNKKGIMHHLTFVYRFIMLLYFIPISVMDVVFGV